MEGKRYYWLKLKDDFFSSKRIKKLRAMAGGDTYLIIYLKMQLVAMKHDGMITWSGLEDRFADELALDLDEKPDDVAVTLMYLLNTQLAETSDNINYFFPYAVENTGSEGASAQRVREYRVRKSLQSNVDVTPVKQIGNGEKEIEIESDIEKESDLTVSKETVCRTKDVRPVIEAWNSLNLATVRELKSDSKRGLMLRARIKEHGVDGVLEAIENIRQSDFLKGQNSRGWVITFDWFVKPNNFIKVLEGNYKNEAKPETNNIFAQIYGEEYGS